MPYHVLLDQLEERERGDRQARDDQPRDRSGLRRQGGASRDPGGRPDGGRWLPGAAARRPGPRAAHRGGLLRRRAARATRCGRRSRRRPTRRRIADEYLAAAERLRPHVVDGQAMVDAALVGRRADPARGAARHDARHRLGDLSLRHLVVADPRRRVDRRRAAGGGDRPGDRRGQGLHHGGRGRTAADRAARRGWRGAARARRRVRDLDRTCRGAAAGTTRWRCDSACGWPATRASR